MKRSALIVLLLTMAVPCLAFGQAAPRDYINQRPAGADG